MSSINGASKSRCNHDGSGSRTEQGQKCDRHRSSRAAMGLHEGASWPPLREPKPMAISASKRGRCRLHGKRRHRLRNCALIGVQEVREQDHQPASTTGQKVYFELEGRPGSQPRPCPPRESGQGSPEPVHRTEVRQRCDTQQVNLMARCKRHPVAAKSDMPLIFPTFFNLGLHNPSRGHNREGQAPSISSPRRDLHSFPARPQTGHA